MFCVCVLCILLYVCIMCVLYTCMACIRYSVSMRCGHGIDVYGIWVWYICMCIVHDYCM